MISRYTCQIQKGRKLLIALLPHQISRGILLSEVGAVDVDVHLNAGSGVKFQPDLVARDKDKIYTLIVDFESPNSMRGYQERTSKLTQNGLTLLNVNYPT